MRFLMDLFPEILDMSITASIVIIIVIVARLLLKKAPKVISYALWGVVLLRLLCPFSFESAISIVPAVPEIEQTQIDSALPSMDFETYSDREENRITLEQVTDSEGVYVRVEHSAEPTLYLSILWLTGVLGMLVYSIVSYIKLRKQLKISVPLRENIFIADDVKSPFVVGFIRPGIYLPGGLGEREQEYIILHEQHHIRRCDHIIKLLSFAALSIHWFNPLVWLAFALSSKDMEMSCDEAVIRKMGEDVRADYSASLLTLATGRRIIAGTPLAFGEGNTESRIKNLSGWKKPVVWVVVVAMIVCGVLAVCLLTDRVKNGDYGESSLTGKLYSVSEVVYDDGIYSFTVIPGKNSPNYAVTENFRLFSRCEHSEEWTELGVPTEFELTGGSFDRLLRSQAWWLNGSAASLRRENAKAWRLVYNEEFLYYLLIQKNGDVYLAYGYYDASEKDDPYSDDSSIRWVYKLTDGIFEDTSMVAVAGDSAVPMVTHPAQTNPQEIKNSVCWLDVSGYYLDLPFEIYWDGESIHYGSYDLIDAETCESVDFFHPSGHSAQAYIFHDALPDRDYIVAMKHPSSDNGLRYCFGVRLGNGHGTVGGAELTGLAYETAYTWVNYSAEGYDAMVAQAENRDTERRYGNVEHLTPVVMLESKSEFDAFYKEMSAYFAFEQSWDGSVPFSTQAEHYTEEFFAQSALFIAYLEEPTTSNSHEVEEVRIENGVLEIRICRINPQVGDTAMAGWFMAVAVPKDTIADCTGYDAYICAEVDPDSVFPSGNLVGAYTYDGGDIAHTATVSLYDDGQFQFIFSPLSSYIGIGSYTLENNRLTLKTYDGHYTYVFDLIDDTLVFDADASSGHTWYSGFTDGAVFE